MVLNWELLYYFVEHLYLVLEAVLNKCFHNGTFLVVISRFRSPSNSCFEQAVDIRKSDLDTCHISPKWSLWRAIFNCRSSDVVDFKYVQLFDGGLLNIKFSTLEICIRPAVSLKR
uniref:Uncharacterized protein n=1 Tax=Physcomitrium patens TaxID=3218 RepID=A0A2K1ITH6_PHYPA|nr:hypothetical protein PHYPA_024522 [Physcomitrium patens]